MIIRGGPAGNVGFWSSHLSNDVKNERAEVREISGLVAEDLPSALREMQAVASGSRSGGNFMYQANINPYANESLTPDQWREAVDTLEKNLGLEGHQRVVIEHVKHGRQHYHVIWNRVDVDTMRVADVGGNYLVHKSTQAELEKRFDLTPTPAAETEKTRAIELWETRAAERTGVDPARLKAEVTELWRASDSGRAFASALEDRGFTLAKGDRRDFCIVDQAGTAHSLARRLDGVTTAQLRDFMSDVDRDALPTVVEARAEQRSNQVSHHLSSIAEARELTTKPDKTINDAGRAAERVTGAAISVASSVVGTLEKLTDAIVGIFDATPPPKPDPVRDAQVASILEQRRADAALEKIRDNLEQRQPIQIDTLRDLMPRSLEAIRTGGDAVLLAMVQQLDDDRQRNLDRGGGRER